MSNWNEVYIQTKKKLAEAGLMEAEAEAKVLLAHVYGGDFSQLYLRFFDVCEQEDEIRELVAQRLTGKPVAYVIGEKYFYGRSFLVDERVLIPRYDTECVVQEALLLARENGYQTALDLCCGSGAIGVTLALEGSFERVFLSDVSQGALVVAKQNKEILAGDADIRFLQGDLFERVVEKTDLIVCNPPYISDHDYRGLETQVKKYEPRLALWADRDGYAFYERLAKEAPRYLNAGGALVLEIGDTQAERVCALLKENGFVKINTGYDLSGRPRFVSATATVYEG
ncbi:MAG: peptide chain release factor N(5)-glutamine methyltransferase [Christensenella sp.]|uniref:peptide chain release factor N(5)-glutamine methyltransferase n=1 Tax=Christensenella sp. TaxID=1935934 RepID=UPI002B2148F4|nr:peptide chain release factor N(5)-glutamine methyltransferase [Christensenella sp.]MEA5003555.1 peptide chain release factor N(5)-glutamine methyltransferase [Christensenella sp.]